jgi:hypothetical protein
MLTLLILIPFIGSLILFLQEDIVVSKDNDKKEEISMKTTNEEKIKKWKETALVTSILNLFLSIFIWFQFDSNYSDYQFVSEFNQWNIFHLNFGIDGISLYFVLLTTIITPISLLSNYKNINKHLKLFLISILMLESLQICAFVSLDLLLFYIFFESAMWVGTSLLCFKLSNSGEALKLKVPSYYRKVVSGWSNYSGMVTSLKMIENEMGNRGSKSDFIPNLKFVKEQRVDGSYLFQKNKLRCTLMGCESNYPISIPSNQRIIHTSTAQHFSNNSFLNRDFQSPSNILRNEHCSHSATENLVNKMEPSHKLNPWFLTGFIDGEGCFGLYIYSNIASKLGYYVILDFKITLHKKDRVILDEIKNYFSVGGVSKHGDSLNNYGVRSIKDLNLIINHFDNFPLKTKKLKDYSLFKLAFNIIKNKEHLTKEGLEKLIEIKSFMNKGLSSDLNKLGKNSNVALPPLNIPSPAYAEIAKNKEFDPNWLAGFASGEGSFQIDIQKSKTSRLGHQVLLRFSIGQHRRDEQLLINLIDYFKCGRVYKKKSKKYNTYFCEYRVEKFKDIENKIIPFFLEHHIQGVKLLDFQDFCKVSDLIKNKSHLTIEGLNQIRKIKEGINRGRILSS